MSRRRTPPLAAASLVVALAIGAIAACGDDGDEQVEPPDEAAAADVPGPPNDAAETGPTRAPFGLDQRPPNPSCTAPPRPAPSTPVSFQRVFTNVIVPTPIAMAQIPGDKTRWFVASLDGTIRSFPVANPPDDPPKVLDLAQVSGMPVAFTGEGGLLGFAFHPKFAQNGRMFVSWTTAPAGPSPMRSIVSRVTTSDNGASFGQHAIVVGPFDQPNEAHLGGAAAFGRDGMLYLSFGDGVMGPDPQSKAGYSSKILRVDVDSAPGPLGYAVPPDNPFVAVAGAEATYAYGFRNPFRFSIDRATGDLWVGDVGASLWEEIDLVKAGGNYGWPCREGAHQVITGAGCDGALGFVDPIVEHDHGGAQPIARAIVGGVVYRGKAIPGLVGAYVYGDFSTGEIWGLTSDPATGAMKSTLLNAAGPTASWTAFNEDDDGEIYAVSLYDGALYKLVPSGPQPPTAFPARLSKTGCFDPSDPKKPTSGLVPFAVNASLWSDGATKDRFLAVPDGRTIHVADDGHFDFPTGTVLAKTFSLGGKRIETRLFMRHDDGEWGGYSYEWLDDQSDAVLLPAGKAAKIGAQTWAFPSRAECMRCHTAAAGRSLGPELGQLNGELLYASTNRISNQLATLDHAGYFDKPLGKAPAAIASYPSPEGPGALEPRARAYLHANCAMCHRPTGPTRSDMDLRFATPARDTRTCNVAPKVDDLGLAAAKLVAPGAPDLSILALRSHALGAKRMPPLASTVVDPVGTTLLDDWIRSIATCP